MKITDIFGNERDLNPQKHCTSCVHCNQLGPTKYYVCKARTDRATLSGYKIIRNNGIACNLYIEKNKFATMPSWAIKRTNFQ